MLRNYGTHAPRILELAAREPTLSRCFTGSHVSFAEAIYAVRAEAAQRMSDIVFRRTELGTDRHPGTAALDELQALLSTELGWSPQRTAEERAIVEREFDRYLATPPPNQSVQQARRA
jgi:glycerol-3-phosphate dehydrogenase